MTNLRSIRIERGFETLTPFAAKLGVSPGHISKIECGVIVPSIRFMFKTEDLLGVEVAKIFPSATEEYVKKYSKLISRLRGENQEKEG